MLRLKAEGWEGIVLGSVLSVRVTERHCGSRDGWEGWEDLGDSGEGGLVDHGKELGFFFEVQFYLRSN